MVTPWDRAHTQCCRRPARHFLRSQLRRLRTKELPAATQSREGCYPGARGAGAQPQTAARAHFLARFAARSAEGISLATLGQVWGATLRSNMGDKVSKEDSLWQGPRLTSP